MARIRTTQLQTVAVASATVPTARTVTSLADALGVVALSGGSIASDTRTAPGIGSWAFVVDTEGNELVLWENAARA